MVEETGEAIDARGALVRWALGELGEQDPRKYYRMCAPDFIATKPNEKSWCGIFCLAGLHAVGLCDWLWSTRRTEPGFVWRLRVTHEPQPGDIVIFGAPLWHHAIVQDVRNGRVYTIDGNVMRAPLEGVATRDRPIDSNVTFYSIASLLEDP